jgi:hypothetical protein
MDSTFVRMSVVGLTVVSIVGITAAFVNSFCYTKDGINTFRFVVVYESQYATRREKKEEKLSVREE